MFEHLSYERFVELSKTNQRIAVYQEIAGDRLTPIIAYSALAELFNDVTLLESNPKELHLGRYSYLCFNQRAMIKAFGQKITIRIGDKDQSLVGNPFDILKQYQHQFKAKIDHPLLGYAGGMVGFISYDAIRLIEDIPDSNYLQDDIPDLFFRFYDHNISFDHQTRKIIISVVADVKDDVESAYKNSIKQINDIIMLITNYYDSSENKKTKQSKVIERNLDDEHFKKMVQRAKEHIIAGDAFQIVLSREFSVKTDAKPFEIYRSLRFSSPAPYMFYMTFDNYAVAGASPEKLVSVKDKVVEARPLAGTRPRSPSINDEKMAAELLADEKEAAEHMMLVDLTRNDIGAISIPGSVKVVKLMTVENFSSVMHLSSTIQGILRDDLNAIDALKAAFPAGTLSGAPKIRAMEIIDDLENTRRGFYGGAVCAFDSLDNLESCIAIRTAVIKNSTAVVRAGAGIVFDSDPQKEADETFHKARSILQGVLIAEELR